MSRPVLPLADRFWAKVQKTEGCWLWTGTTRQKGYGSIGVTVAPGRQVSRPAHRVSYELAYGPIPAGLYVCHKCDNPPCVRPDHLFAGTPRENTQDWMAKGKLPARITKREKAVGIAVCPKCSGRWDRTPLTRRQRQVMDFIEAHVADAGYAPSFEEIAARFGFRSLATVHEHLVNIERKGYITRRHNESRSIALATSAA